MKRLEVKFEATIAGDPRDVWALLRDWAALPSWWPKDAPMPILRCEPLGDPSTLPFGRRLHFPQGGSADEYLMLADDEHHRLHYRLVNGGLPGILNYVATNTVDPAGPGQSKLSFSSTFDASDDADEAALKGMLLGVYQISAHGIGQALQVKA